MTGFLSATDLLQNGVVYGTVLSLFMSVAFLGIAYLNPEIWLGDYPPDIRERYGPMSIKARRQRMLAGIPVVSFLLGTIVFSTVRLAQGDGGDSAFFAVLLGTFLMLLVFNVVDLVILDWLIFVTIRPRMIVLSGTEGMEGYHDYGFHFRAFLKGVVGSFAASLVVAGIVVVIKFIVL